MALEAQAPRLAVITGVGGLGFQTALTLARAGIGIVLAGRNPEKGREAVERLRAEVPGAEVRFEILDLASLDSVSAFVTRMKAGGEPIDILINNAGIMMPPERQTTQDGHELQFGVNYLGHFALTGGLLPLLSPRARVVSLTSLAQRAAKLDPADIGMERNYNGGRAYCNSKLLLAMFAVELHRRAGALVTSVAAHPGFATTNIFNGGQTKSTLQSVISTRLIAPLLGHSAAAGAQSIVHAALSSQVAGGRLYGPQGLFGMKGPPGESQFASSVHDPELRARIWEASQRSTGHPFPDLPA